MTHLFTIQPYSSTSIAILAVCIGALCLIIVYFVLKMIELGYVMKYRRPYFVHTPFLLRKLDDKQRFVLSNQFQFYNKLTPKHQRYFEHRVASFIVDKHFVGREGLIVTDEMKVLISATAVMLTFGFRDFYIGLISRIVIYPNVFYSNTNKAYHKGEFNPRLAALVFSWEDFVKGFNVGNDNINLGIHEFTHAIHINSMKERDVSSTIFSDSFKELSGMLASNETLRNKLKESDYFRKYAFTNQFEFVAVIIENFIETPKEFRSQFPQVYDKVKQMLNFNVVNY